MELSLIGNNHSSSFWPTAVSISLLYDTNQGLPCSDVTHGPKIASKKEIFLQYWSSIVNLCISRVRIVCIGSGRSYLAALAALHHFVMRFCGAEDSVATGSQSEALT